MTLNDAILAATGGPTVNDGLRSWFSLGVANPETYTLNDLQFRWCKIQMPASNKTTLNDLWEEYLTTVWGLILGTINDKEYQYWLDNAEATLLNSATVYYSFIHQLYGISPSIGAPRESKTFAEAVTFTRASSGTYIDAAGVMQTAAVNEPRFGHDPVSLAPLGLLAEEARTNLVTQSEFANGITDAPVRGGLVTASAFSGLIGSTGIAFGHDGVTSSYAYKTFTATAGTVYTLSVYVRMDDGGVPVPRVSGNSDDPLVDFSVICEGAYVAPTMTDMGGGLYRVDSSRTAAVVNPNWGIIKYRGNSPRTFTVSGYQLEAAPYASSYIPTTTTQVTRAADVANTPVAGWHNPLECTLVVRGSAKPGAAGGNGVLAQVGTSSQYPAAIQQSSSTARLSSRDASVLQADFTFPNSPGVTFSAGMAVKENDFAVSLNGSVPDTDNSGTVFAGSTYLQIGNFGGTINFANGYIQEIAYFPTRLTNEQLQEITQ